MSTVNTGNAGEEAAAAVLANDGYEIIMMNWKTTFAEIDIIALKDKVLYFVEVKYRRNDYAGDGFDYITPKKLQHMRRAAEAYVQSSGWPGSYELMAAAVTGESTELATEFREI